MHAIGRRGRGLRRDDAGNVAAVADWIAARVELQLVDEERVQNRRAEGEVEQRGRAYAVDEVAGVPRIGAANGVERQRPRRLRHAGQRFHHPEGIAQRARGVHQLFPLERHGRLWPGHGRDDGFVALANRARFQPHDEVTRIGRHRHLPGDGNVAGTLHAQVVRAGENLDGEPAVRAGLGIGGGAVTDPKVNQGADQGLPRPAREHPAGESHQGAARGDFRQRLNRGSARFGAVNHGIRGGIDGATVHGLAGACAPAIDGRAQGQDQQPER